MAARASAFSVVLVGVAAMGDFRDTYRALVEQPTPPALNHPTPWVGLAPRLPVPGAHLTEIPSVLHHYGGFAATHTSGIQTELVFVSGGPGRMLDVVLAVLLGIFVWRRPQSPVVVLWVAAAILASRCFFEPVMTPYYLAPPLILGVVMAAAGGWVPVLGRRDPLPRGHGVSVSPPQ